MKTKTAVAVSVHMTRTAESSLLTGRKTNKNEEIDTIAGWFDIPCRKKGSYESIADFRRHSK